MNRKIYKGLALTFALILIGGLGWFANGLLGNPVSKALAQKTAEAHLSDGYPNTDYQIKAVDYSFKDGRYTAHIISPSSIDSTFSLQMDHWGKLLWDSYDSRVKNGWNTAMRLDGAYRALTDTVFEADTFPYHADIAYGTLEIHRREAMEDPLADEIPDYALVMEELVLDHTYDIKALGAEVGHLIVYLEQDTITNAEAAKLLMGIRAQFDKAGIPFRVIDFHLQTPKTEGEQRSDLRLDIESFPYESIDAEGLETRVAEAVEATRAYYAQMEK